MKDDGRQLDAAATHDAHAYNGEACVIAQSHACYSAHDWLDHRYLSLGLKYLWLDFQVERGVPEPQKPP